MTKTPENFGFLTMAFGKKRFIEEAECLAKTLKMHMPNIEIAIITDQPTVSDVFDHKVEIDLTHGFGTIQKVYIDKYSPFEQTFFIDTDCLVTRPFYEELKAISQYDFTHIHQRFSTKEDEDNFIVDLNIPMKALGIDKYPKFNGGVYFFKKNKASKKIFQTARELIEQREELGLIGQNGEMPVDESLFALSLAKLGIFDYYNDHGRLMRTPLGIKGKFEIDIMGGGCRFIKDNELVEPAICHFAGEYIKWPQYRSACFVLKHEYLPKITHNLIHLSFRAVRKFKHICAKFCKKTKSL